MTIRDRPQPEVLYRDYESGDTLVIERKNFVWPLDYAERHQAEHFLMGVLIDGLGAETRDAPYALTFQSGLSIDREELRRLADKVILVTPWIGRLEPGQGIGSQEPEKGYRFWLQSDWERHEADPSKGLVIELPQKPSPDLNDPNRLPERLAREIQRCFHSCKRKFAEYEDSRRILLLDQHGEMRYLGERWWQTVLAQAPPPSPVSEIWLGLHNWVTDGEEGWIFSKLYPATHAAL